MGRLSDHLRVILAAGLFAWAAPLGAEEVQVVKSGKYYGKIDAYRVDDRFYLSARDAAKIYGGQRYWRAVKGVVQLSFRGRQASFTKDSAVAAVAGKEIVMIRPMLVRARRAFIPIEFFSSEAFSELAGVDTIFKPGTRLLLVDQRSNVGPLRWFTYTDHTRVVLELGESLRYQTSKRGRYGYDIAIPNGAIEWSERIDVNDGVLEYVHMFQEKKQARLSLKMQPGAAGLRLREFSKPRRLVIDIARSGDLAKAARSARVAMEAPAPPKKRRWFRRKQAPAQPAAGALSGAAAAPTSAEPQPEADTQPPAPAVPVRSRERPVIAIDAGHGGKDGGAVGRRGTLEKDVNLQAAKELAYLLRQEGRFDVFMIRSEDIFVKLGERAKLSNQRGADLFVSLHANANNSRSLSGFEIYFLSERASDPGAERLAEFENSVLALEGEEVFEDDAATVLYALAKSEFINDSAELAGLMTKNLSRRVDLRNRGVKQAAFYVLRGVNAPAVLVEMAFLSNARDEAKLQSGKYRRKIIEGIYAGIIDYAERKQLLEPEAR